MEIRPISDLQVAGTLEKLGETPKILLENQDSGKQVEVLGKVLEAQFGVGDNFLVLITEGSPFEEALYIYYLNDCLKVMDCLELSAMYAAGMLGGISISSSDEIVFSFFESADRWVLTVYSDPRYTISCKSYPVKRKLSVFKKRWLSLKKA